ncbi:hypothetical protein AAY473_013750 [Plecturocebus cupreus]
MAAFSWRLKHCSSSDSNSGNPQIPALCSHGHPLPHVPLPPDPHGWHVIAFPSSGHSVLEVRSFQKAEMQSSLRQCKAGSIWLCTLRVNCVLWVLKGPSPTARRGTRVRLPGCRDSVSGQQEPSLPYQPEGGSPGSHPRERGFKQIRSGYFKMMKISAETELSLSSWGGEPRLCSCYRKAGQIPHVRALGCEKTHEQPQKLAQTSSGQCPCPGQDAAGLSTHTHLTPDCGSELSARCGSRPRGESVGCWVLLVSSLRHFVSSLIKTSQEKKEFEAELDELADGGYSQSQVESGPWDLAGSLQPDPETDPDRRGVGQADQLAWGPGMRGFL